MAALLPNPYFQFVDADGMPYAGGTLTTFVPGTTTGKVTWSEPSGTVVNANPITLDAAGRAIVYGDGDYRLILNDAVGNLIFDQPSSTIVSAAMQPVVSAPTVAEAARLLGVGDAVAAEAAARIAADSAEQAARIAADNAETARAEAAENTLTTNLNAEIARAEAAEAALGTGAVFDSGQAVTATDGRLRVTFATTFGVAPAVAVQHNASGYSILCAAVAADTTGFDVWFAFPLTSGVTPAGTTYFSWIAMAG